MEDPWDECSDQDLPPSGEVSPASTCKPAGGASGASACDSIGRATGSTSACEPTDVATDEPIYIYSHRGVHLWVGHSSAIFPSSLATPRSWCFRGFCCPLEPQ